MEINNLSLWYLSDRSIAAMEVEHDPGGQWACDCCGMRFTTVDEYIVSPRESLVGSRIYFNGHLPLDAGEHNVVHNINTKNGPLAVVLTKTVLTENHPEYVDYCCASDDDDDAWYDEEPEEDEESGVPW